MRNGSLPPKQYTREQAEKKVEHYCAYQERSQHEVRSKLYEWGLRTPDVEEIISRLISDNFLNEERFATAYALGKFRIKGWGKLKIRQALKLKRVPDKMIARVLATISYDDYTTKLQTLLDKKSLTLDEPDGYKKRILLTRYAVSKGYEQELISGLLK